MKKNIIILTVLIAAGLTLNINNCEAQWLQEVQLTSSPGHSFTSGNYSKCVAAEGNFVHVVCYSNRDGNMEIYYIRSSDGGITWSADTRLTNDNADSFEPSVAVSGSVVHVVWYDNRDNSLFYEIYYKRSTDGGLTWGPDTRLTYDSDYSRWASVSVSGQVVHVVWVNGDATSLFTNLFYKRSTDQGVSWESAIQLTNTNQSLMSNPSISVSGQNVNVAVSDMDSGSGGYWNAFYIHSPDGGTNWGAYTRLTNATGHSFSPCISASGSGVHVVFFSNRDGTRVIYYKRSANGGISWEADTRLTPNNTDCTDPSVSASGSLVHVVWNSQGGGLEYQKSIDGGNSWGNIVQISPVCRLFPSVAVSDLTVHVIWTGTNGDYEIIYNHNPNGNITGVNSPLMYEGSFTVFPNPTSDKLTIAFPKNNNKNTFLKIINSLGQQVHNQLISNNTGTTTIDISQFAEGIYIVEIYSKEWLEKHKLVIQR
jgi:hypothetical protein